MMEAKENVPCEYWSLIKYHILHKKSQEYAERIHRTLNTQHSISEWDLEKELMEF